MRRIPLLLAVLAVPAALAGSSPAAAATKPCDIVQVITVAVQNGTVPAGYSLSCLYRARAAAAKDPDLSTYTEVDSALRSAIIRAGGKPRPATAQVPTSPETGPGKTTASSGTKTASTATKPNPTKTVTRSPAAVEGKPADDGGSVPGPVIALGVVALAGLVAATVVELRRRRA